MKKGARHALDDDKINKYSIFQQTTQPEKQDRSRVVVSHLRIWYTCQEKGLTGLRI